MMTLANILKLVKREQPVVLIDSMQYVLHGRACSLLWWLNCDAYPVKSFSYDYDGNLVVRVDLDDVKDESEDTPE